MYLHLFFIFLGVSLFYITNFIGNYSRNFGYSDIQFDIKYDEIAGFNVVLRLLTPSIYIILISSIIYYFNLDSWVKNIYIAVIYSFAYRILWNILHNRTMLINWYAQLMYSAVASLFAYLAYKHFILPKNPLFPNLETIANELWMMIFLFLYKVFNEFTFPRKYKEKRVQQFIETREKKFRSRYQLYIAIGVHHKIQQYIPSVKKIYGEYSSLTIKQQERSIEKLLCACIFSIMIFEDYNRPFLFRKIETLLCRISKKEYTQGLMQTKSSTPIDDIESIDLAISKILDDFFFEVITTQHTSYLYPIIIETIEHYNSGYEYYKNICTIFGKIGGDKLIKDIEAHLPKQDGE